MPETKGKFQGWGDYPPYFTYVSDENPSVHLFHPLTKDGVILSSWVDHASMDVDEDGNEVFYSEPYQLSSKCLEELYCMSGRFNVSITGNSSWNPGACLLITIKKKFGKSET